MNLLLPRLSLLLSVFVFVSPCGFAADTVGKAEAAADSDWTAFQQAMQPPPSAKDTDYAGRIRWGMNFVQGVLTTGQNFYDRHPSDPPPLGLRDADGETIRQLDRRHQRP